MRRTADITAVRVTDDHIARGIGSDVTDCALALALRDAFPGYYVTVGSVLATLSRKERTSPMAQPRVTLAMTARTYRFRRQFDGVAAGTSHEVPRAGVYYFRGSVTRGIDGVYGCDECPG